MIKKWEQKFTLVSFLPFRLNNKNWSTVSSYAQALSVNMSKSKKNFTLWLTKYNCYICQVAVSFDRKKEPEEHFFLKQWL